MADIAGERWRGFFERKGRRRRIVSQFLKRKND